MKNTFRIKRLLFVLAAMLISVLCAVCFVACDGDKGDDDASRLEFISITDGYNKIAYRVYGIGTETATDIVIPSKHKGLPVEGIMGYAFEDCSNVTSVVIPNSVTWIGKGAFTGCTGLTSVVIPDSVTEIGEGAFTDCTSLTSIVIPASVTTIEENLFSGCSSLESIELPNLSIKIKENVFDDTAYYKDESNWENDVLYVGKHLIAAKKTIAGEYSVKQDTLTLANRAFFYCESITKIEIPDSVIAIGRQAFWHCIGLASVNIPNSVTIIELDTFYYCGSLTSIVIPDSVTRLQGGAFMRCSRLSSIVIPDTVMNIGSDAFEDTAYYNDESNWENGVLYIGKHLIKAKKEITGEYTIRQDTLTIADDAFKSCDKLTNVSIPAELASVGYSVFLYCNSLTSITFNGTKEQWEQATALCGNSWQYQNSIKTVVCTDGTVTLSDD